VTKGSNGLSTGSITLPGISAKGSRTFKVEVIGKFTSPESASFTLEVKIQ
jgi:hypothetical protein